MEENKRENPQTITISTEKNEYAMVPGVSTDILLNLTNSGENQEYYEIGIRGIPTSWVKLSDQVVNLASGEEKSITLTIQLPPPPQSQAGIYPVKVVATSQADPRQMAEVDLSLHVAVFESSGRIGVMMESIQFSVSAGSSTDVPVLLLNQGLEADSFRLSLEGLPVNWISTQTPITRLEPGERKGIKLTIHPPRSPSSKAGRHSFKIRFTSQMIPEDFVEVSLILTLAVFSEFRAALKPVQAEAGAAIKLMIENNGNVDQAFDLTWQTQENALLFEAIVPAPEPETPQQGSKPEPQVVPLSESYPLRVPSGEVGAVDFRGQPAKRVIIGGEKAHPYSVAVKPVEKDDTQALIIDGQMTSRALIPAWVLPAVFVILVAFGCLFVLLSGRSGKQTASATETAAYGTAVAMGATQTVSANQTAAAESGQEDSDGDGLINNEEIQLGTDPYNPDTDGDELWDGREVKELKTNPLKTDTDEDALSDGDEVLRRSTDPLKPDTDSDGLGDGDEVKRGTDPLNPDTDRDGLQDGKEVEIGTDPLKPDTDNDELLDGKESLPCPNPLDPDSDKDGIIDGKDLDPCDANNPSLTATAGAGQPPTEEATQIPPTEEAPQETPPAITLPGKIAFMSTRDGNPEIYVQNGASQAITRLTDNPAADTQPAWSPDTTRLAFTTNRDGNNEIYLMNADGSNLINISNAPTADDQHPTWSSDGQWIAFSTNRDGNWEIYAVRVDGTEPRNLTNNSADDTYPTWFSNRSLLSSTQQIAFASNRDGNLEIYVMNTDGSNPVNLTNNPAGDNFPSGSGDGSRIAFVSDREGQLDIFLMGSNGSSPVNLTNNPAADLYPSWSPDDKGVAFSSNRGNLEVYVIRTDGSNLVNFTNNPADDDFPAWH